MPTNGGRTLRPVPPDAEIIAWLWSAEGILWHQKTVKAVRHSSGHFAVVKDDHECGPNDIMCGITAGSPYPDERITADIRRYGISGVPREWKQAQKRLNEA